MSAQQPVQLITRAKNETIMKTIAPRVIISLPFFVLVFADQRNASAINSRNPAPIPIAFIQSVSVMHPAILTMHARIPPMVIGIDIISTPSSCFP
nr:MAG TPA: hypothetical protein [Caudoviricetes sp.]